jgi:hypothetical protein
MTNVSRDEDPMGVAEFLGLPTKETETNKGPTNMMTNPTNERTKQLLADLEYDCAKELNKVGVALLWRIRYYLIVGQRCPIFGTTQTTSESFNA